MESTNKDYRGKIATNLNLVPVAKDNDPSISVIMHQTFFIEIFSTICLISAAWIGFI